MTSLPTVEAPSSTSLPTVEALELPASQQESTTSITAVTAKTLSLLQLKLVFCMSLLTSIMQKATSIINTWSGASHNHQRPASEAKFWQLDNTKLAAAKEEFHRLVQEGIIRHSNSDWASHMVQKADRSWRPCGDYRCLNFLTEDNCYPLPNMADITSSLAGATVFSKLDLKKGYHQILWPEERRHDVPVLHGQGVGWPPHCPGLPG